MAHFKKTEEEVGKLTAIFWAEFVKNAILPVDYEYTVR